MKSGDYLYCIKNCTPEFIYNQMGLYSLDYNCKSISYNTRNFCSVGKLYEIISINDLNLYIIGDDKLLHHFSIDNYYSDCYKKYFITIKQLRKQKIDKLNFI